MPWTLGSEFHAKIVRATDFVTDGTELSMQARINALAARIAALEQPIDIVTGTVSEEYEGGGGLTLVPP